MQSLGRMAEAADDEIALEQEQQQMQQQQPELLASITGLGQVSANVYAWEWVCVRSSL
jgi:transposase